jgi:hypothetical protein
VFVFFFLKGAYHAENSIEKKLGSIVFEEIKFDEVDIIFAFEYIRAQSKKIDKEGKGINIILKNIKKGTCNVSLELTSIPAGELIRYICLSSGLQYKLETYAVIIEKKSED